MSRRRRGGPGLTIIYWRDIPAQVTGITADGTTEKAELEPRFHHAIDRAAAVAGLTETDDYIEQWRREPAAIEGDGVGEAAARASAMQAAYPRERLEALVASGGLEPQPDGGPDQ